MNTFTYFFATASLIIFVGFVVASNLAFGWMRSYSAYAAKWTETVPINRETHLWSIITVVVALLLFPALIAMGEKSPLQFLGFFAPLYLCVVAFTPEYESQPGDDDKMAAKRKRQRIVHTIGTVACAIASIIWIIVICRLWWVILVAAAILGTVAYLTKTYKTSYIFWAEMSLFLSVYAVIYIGG